MSNIKDILINKKICKSVWFMRQAGRYLPEFRNIRSQNQNFIELCLNSDLSSEITLQPIKRFNFDSAIIFSDILMVPYALGQKVDFIKDQGPKLENFNFKKFINNDKVTFTQKLLPIYKAIENTCCLLVYQFNTNAHTCSLIIYTKVLKSKMGKSWIIKIKC